MPRVRVAEEWWYARAVWLFVGTTEHSSLLAQTCYLCLKPGVKIGPGTQAGTQAPAAPQFAACSHISSLASRLHLVAAMPRLAALATQLLSTTYRVVISTTETAKLGLFASLAALYGLVALLIDMFVGAPEAFYRAPARHRRGRRRQSSSSNRRGRRRA